MEIRLACVVEGHGEVSALPVLLRRIAMESSPHNFLKIQAVIRTPKTKLKKAGELERAAELAARKASPGGGVLILVDADEDCARNLGPEFLRRASTVRGSEYGMAVVIAVNEFEAWFVAAAESLRGLRGLSGNLMAERSPEDLRDPKGWLSRHMTRRYAETVDQAALASEMDLTAAKTAKSFNRLYQEMVRLMHKCENEAQTREKAPS